MIADTRLTFCGTRRKPDLMRSNRMPFEELDNQLEHLLDLLNTNRRPGLVWLKSVAIGGQDLPLRDGVALEGMISSQFVATSSHPSGGVRAFLEKRNQTF